MRIHTRPTHIDFQTGEPTQFAVSVVGKAPHKTYYVEESLGYVPQRELGPGLVGQVIVQELSQKCFAELVEEHGIEKAQELTASGQVMLNVPEIPGVTAPGEWRNPRYGNPDRHRMLYGLKHRTPEVERQVIGNPERFTA